MSLLVNNYATWQANFTVAQHVNFHFTSSKQNWMNGFSPIAGEIIEFWNRKMFKNPLETLYPPFVLLRITINITWAGRYCLVRVGRHISWDQGSIRENMPPLGRHIGKYAALGRHVVKYAALGPAYWKICLPRAAYWTISHPLVPICHPSYIQSFCAMF